MWTEILTFLSVFQKPYLDGCPENLKWQPFLDFDLVAGRWYEHSRYPNFFQDSNRCTTVDVESIESSHAAYFVNVTSLDAFGNKDVVKNIYSNIFDTALNVLQVDPLIKNIWKGLVWILTRERVPSRETLQTVYNVLTENNLLLDPLIKADQDNCDEGVDD